MPDRYRGQGSIPGSVHIVGATGRATNLRRRDRVVPSRSCSLRIQLATSGLASTRASSLAVGCVHTRDQSSEGDASLSTPVQPPIQNKILAALPTDEYERLRGLLTPVSLPLGETLYEQDSRIEQ